MIDAIMCSAIRLAPEMHENLRDFRAVLRSMAHFWLRSACLPPRERP